jgi:hypothetical protein
MFLKSCNCLKLRNADTSVKNHTKNMKPSIAWQSTDIYVKSFQARWQLYADQQECLYSLGSKTEHSKWTHFTTVKCCNNRVLTKIFCTEGIKTQYDHASSLTPQDLPNNICTNLPHKCMLHVWTI